MSRSLTRLRDATGDPLLVRAGRGLVPTPRALKLRDQVNESVSQLDTVTQQNAALVEESAASAEGLNTSGVMLSRAAQVFHLR